MCNHSVVSDCDPMDCSLPGSSVHGIFQARLLEWVAISYSRDNAYNVRTWCQSPFLSTSWAKDTLWRTLPTYSVFLHGYPPGISSYETFLLDPVLLFPHSFSSWSWSEALELFLTAEDLSLRLRPHPFLCSMALPVSPHQFPRPEAAVQVSHFFTSPTLQSPWRNETEQM